MTPDPQTGKLPVIPDEEDSDDPSPALALRASGKMVKPPKDSPVPRPVFLSAYLMKGNVESEFIAEGNAEGNAVVQAAIDGLIAQTRGIERAVALLELGDAVAIEDSDSLGNPDAVFQ